MGSFFHAVDGPLLCSSLTPDKVTYFTAHTYLLSSAGSMRVFAQIDEV
jgi:hypothetical protein